MLWNAACYKACTIVVNVVDAYAKFCVTQSAAAVEKKGLCQYAAPGVTPSTTGVGETDIT